MVQPAIANIVGPAVTAEDPEGILGEQLLALVDFVEQRVTVGEGQDVTDGVAVFLAFLGVAAISSQPLKASAKSSGSSPCKALTTRSASLA